MNSVENEGYALLLRRIFDSHDLHGKGYLDEDELRQLCTTLELDSYADHILGVIIEDDDGAIEVPFEKFRDVFMDIISQPSDDGGEVGTDTADDISEVDPEASGGVISPRDMDEFRRFWNENSYNRSGYVRLNELGDICNHVGMGQLSNQELEILMKSLDHDRDGRLSFDDFFRGLSNSKRENSHPSEALSTISEVSSSTSFSRPPKRIMSDTTRYRDLLNSFCIQNNDLNREDLTKYLVDSGLHREAGKLEDAMAEKMETIDIADLCGMLEDAMAGNGHDFCRISWTLFQQEIRLTRANLNSASTENASLRLSMTRAQQEKEAVIKESEEQLQTLEQLYKSKVSEITNQSTSRIDRESHGWREERELIIEDFEKELRAAGEEANAARSEALKLKAQCSQLEEENKHLRRDLDLSQASVMSLENKLLSFQQSLGEQQSRRQEVGDEASEVHQLRQTCLGHENIIRKLQSNEKDLQQENASLCKQLDLLRDQMQAISECHAETIVLGGNPGIPPLALDMSPHLGKSSDAVELYRVQTTSQSPPDLDSSNNLTSMSSAVRRLSVPIAKRWSTIRSLKEEMFVSVSDEDGSLSQRYQREISGLSDRFIEEMEAMQSQFSADKEKMMSEHQKRLIAQEDEFRAEKEVLLKSFQQEKDEILAELENERKYLQDQLDSELQHIEQLYQDEKSDLERKSKSQLRKLEEKLIMSDTEKAEMELKFVSDRADIEQRCRLDKAEMEQRLAATLRELDKTKQSLEVVVDDMTRKHKMDLAEADRQNRKEKAKLMADAENRIRELTAAVELHQSELRMRTAYQSSDSDSRLSLELSSLKESHAREKAAAEEEHNRVLLQLRESLARDYEEKLSLEVVEMKRKLYLERTERDYVMEDDKQRQMQETRLDKAEIDVIIQKVRSDLELKFSEEKTMFQERMRQEKRDMELRHQTQVEVLLQERAEVETGLSSKQREDLLRQQTELELSFQAERSALLESFVREKADLEKAWAQEKSRHSALHATEVFTLEEALREAREQAAVRLQDTRQALVEEHALEMQSLRKEMQENVDRKVVFETRSLSSAVEHMQAEIVALHDQKRELESRACSLELKVLASKQAESEMSTMRKDRAELEDKFIRASCERDNLCASVTALTRTVNELELEKKTLISNALRDTAVYEGKLLQTTRQLEQASAESREARRLAFELESLQNELSQLKRQLSDKRQENEALSKNNEERVDLVRKNRDLQTRCRELTDALHESTLKQNHFQREMVEMQEKLASSEEAFSKELDSLRERNSSSVAEAATEKSRLLREINEIKAKLYHVMQNSDRDHDMKEKIFNEAKVEVGLLNSKLEEKSKRVTHLEELCRQLKVEKSDMAAALKASEVNLKKLRCELEEVELSQKTQRHENFTKIARSGSLQIDLYSENCQLSRRISELEIELRTSETQRRQLYEQKQTLQRVISKLCRAASSAH